MNKKVVYLLNYDQEFILSYLKHICIKNIKFNVKVNNEEKEFILKLPVYEDVSYYVLDVIETDKAYNLILDLDFTNLLVKIKNKLKESNIEEALQNFIINNIKLSLLNSNWKKLNKPLSNIVEEGYAVYSLDGCYYKNS